MSNRPPPYRIALYCLLTLALVRLWVLPLPSSFWVDEMVTAFVVHFGPRHPSLAAAPQVAESIYYALPKAAENVFGFSETVYRVPSTLLMAVALYLIFRLAKRLIHPAAGWFAVFACLTMRLFNYQADDARPYALGTCVACAAVWFLVRWFDDAKWRDAFLFVIFAALLWRVHLIYWPFYLVFIGYATVRLMTSQTSITWLRASLVFLAVGATLVPVALHALTILREAKAHVIVDHPPRLLELTRVLKFALVGGCLAGASLLNNFFEWPRRLRGPHRVTFAPHVFALVIGWWLVHPLVLFAFSWLTGNSVFVDRYLSLALPGAALAGTLAAAYFLPEQHWHAAAVGLGAGVVLFMGNIGQLRPLHDNSNWRKASETVNRLHLEAATPIIFPSPFIEARSPVWHPNFPMPGFLSSHILTYPIDGRAILFPFETSPEAEAFADQLARGPITQAGRVIIVGGDANAHLWQSWFSKQAALNHWNAKRLGPFGDVDAVVLERR